MGRLATIFLVRPFIVACWRLAEAATDQEAAEIIRRITHDAAAQILVPGGGLRTLGRPYPFRERLVVSGLPVRDRLPVGLGRLGQPTRGTLRPENAQVASAWPPGPRGSVGLIF